MGDTLKLRHLLYATVGALAPPHAKAQPGVSLIPLDDIAAARLQKTAVIQKAVRSVLIRSLQIWRSDLQLEDHQIEPILAHLRSLMQAFENAHISLHEVCAEKQWRKLR